jgi:hypothetical protein
LPDVVVLDPEPFTLAAGELFVVVELPPDDSWPPSFVALPPRWCCELGWLNDA